MVNVHLLPFLLRCSDIFCVTAHNSAESIFEPKKSSSYEEYIFNHLLPEKDRQQEKDGTVPVMGRVTVDGAQTQFSCKITIDPKVWDAKGVVPPDEVQPPSKPTVCLAICQ